MPKIYKVDALINHAHSVSEYVRAKDETEALEYAQDYGKNFPCVSFYVEEVTETELAELKEELLEDEHDNMIIDAEAKRRAELIAEGFGERPDEELSPVLRELKKCLNNGSPLPDTRDWKYWNPTMTAKPAKRGDGV